MTAVQPPAGSLSWANECVAGKKILFHCLGAAGLAIKVYPPQTYSNEENKDPTVFNCTVIELDDGNALIAEPENFLEIDAKGLSFFYGAGSALKAYLVETAKYAASLGVDMSTAIKILVTLLTAQATTIGGDQVQEVIG